VKSAERQAALVDHETREFLVRQQTRTVNAFRAHLAEFGTVVPKGNNVVRLLAATGETPEAARPALELLAARLRDTRARIADVTQRVAAAQAEDALARRRAIIPGIGALTASALAATTPGVGVFRSARDHAAWPGAEAAFDRRQGAAGPDLEGREPVSAPAPVPRADQRAPTPEAGQGLAVADATEKPREGRRHRAGQPHGAGGP